MRLLIQPLPLLPHIKHIGQKENDLQLRGIRRLLYATIFR
jgi:hypothetical protein